MMAFYRQLQGIVDDEINLEDENVHKLWTADYLR